MIFPAPKPRKAPKPKARPKRKSRPKPANAARRKKEFARAYGSKARVEWVKQQPCAACGVVGYSQNAHVIDDGGAGMGRKSGLACIAPLCGPRPSVVIGVTYVGCHSLFDDDAYCIRMRYDFCEYRAAAETERRWQEELKRRKP